MEKSKKITDSERLILEVEKKPCLWQTASEEYSRREIKDKAWEEVCRELYPQCEDYFEIQKQVADLKKKWVNIRAYYRKEMLVRKEDMNGQANPKRKKYVFADILHFLDPVLDNKEPDDNNDNYSEENNIYPGEEEENPICLQKEKIRKNSTQNVRGPKGPRNGTTTPKIRKHSKKSDMIIAPEISILTPNPIQHANIIKEEEVEDLRKNITSPITTVTTDMKPKIIETINPVEMEILNILKSIQQSPQNNKETDPDTSFLLSLVPDMKSLTDMQKIQFKTGVFLLLNQLKFSNSNLNIHSPSPIPFAKSQFNFPFYNPWTHYIQEAQSNSSVNNIPSSLNVSPPLPSSSTTTVSNPAPLYPRDTSTGSAFSPAPCTPMSKNYH